MKQEETIYQGFPYDKIIPELIRSTIDFDAVAQSYFNYYNNQSYSYQSATISVIDTRYLSDLACSLKQMFESNSVSLQLFDRASVQRLDLYEE